MRLLAQQQAQPADLSGTDQLVLGTPE